MATDFTVFVKTPSPANSANGKGCPSKTSAPSRDLHACSAAHDCRIVFAKQKHPQTGTEVLLLVNIGSHDEVY